MKRANKLTIVALTCLSVIALAGCQKDKQNDVSALQDEATGSIKPGTQSTYTATLTQDAIVNGDATTLYIDDVQSISKIDELKALGSSEIVLNAETSKVEPTSDTTEFKKGDSIEFVLKSPVITTMSIPPQIPGSVIVSVKHL